MSKKATSHRTAIYLWGGLAIIALGCIATWLATSRIQVLLAMPTSTIILSRAPLSPPLAPTLAPGATRVASTDNMVQVYVPAGDFTKGSNGGGSDAKPRHTVYLAAYWIDQTEVTQGMYTRCQAAGKCRPPSGVNGGDNHPVIYVDWDDANTYCAWVGRRLPTEAEWEKAARGSAERQYPWGNAEPDCARANGGLKAHSCVGETVAVGSYPRGASPYGALDMAGNVTEWVYDWYDSHYYQNSPRDNPTGSASGQYRVLRGGSWHVVAGGLRATFRSYYPPESKYSTVGFRCLLPAP